MPPTARLSGKQLLSADHLLDVVRRRPGDEQPAPSCWDDELKAAVGLADGLVVATDQGVVVSAGVVLLLRDVVDLRLIDRLTGWHFADRAPDQDAARQHQLGFMPRGSFRPAQTVGD